VELICCQTLICYPMPAPRYPEIEVRVAKPHPPLVIAATRAALRRAGVAKPQIDDFSAQAFASADAPSVCRRWVRLVVGPKTGVDSCVRSEKR
jgi:hypothetical protein